MKTKERPILFNEPMVQAILAGTKTQTRRPMKAQPDGQPVRDPGDGRWYVNGGPWLASPPAAVGDVLWVRETWRTEELPSGEDGVRFAADGAFVPIANTEKAANDWIEAHNNGKYGLKLRPSIHMPRWAARIFLRVTDVRVQRVRDITEDDAMAEGVNVLDASQFTVDVPARLINARVAFGDLWSEVYGRDSWDCNEWVWALTFERIA